MPRGRCRGSPTTWTPGLATEQSRSLSAPRLAGAGGTLLPGRETPAPRDCGAGPAGGSWLACEDGSGRATEAYRRTSTGCQLKGAAEARRGPGDKAGRVNPTGCKTDGEDGPGPGSPPGSLLEGRGDPPPRGVAAQSPCDTATDRTRLTGPLAHYFTRSTRRTRRDSRAQPSSRSSRLRVNSIAALAKRAADG